MPTLRTSDGAELHWEEQGSGPSVLLVPYFMSHPSIFEGIASELSGHRLVTYDARGTGESSRSGPYDMETGAADLAAVCEAAGGIDVAMCLIDAGNLAVRVAARDEDLIREVVIVGSAPFGFRELEGTEGMLGSRAVINAFQQQLETDYRGAVYAAMAGAAADMSTEELHERAALQIGYAEGEAAAGRSRSWAEDGESQHAGRAIGTRMHVLLSEAMGGGANSWFPEAKALERMVAEEFPEADVAWVSDGIVTAPAETAAQIKRLAASAAKVGDG